MAIGLLCIVVRLEAMLSPERIRPFGHIVCGDDNQCPMHRDWKEVIEAGHRFLQSTTVQWKSATCPRA